MGRGRRKGRLVSIRKLGFGQMEERKKEEKRSIEEREARNVRGERSEGRREEEKEATG